MNYFTKSKIFLYFCLSFALGILLASFWKIPILALFSAGIIAVALIGIFWRKKKIVVAGFCLIFLATGIYRFQSVSDGKSFIAQYNDSKENIIIQGIVSEEPDMRIKDTQYVIAVQKPDTLGRSESKWTPSVQVMAGISNIGKVLITLPHYPAYQYGDLIELEGKLKTPAEFDSFSYKDYLAKDDIYSVTYSPKTKFISSGNGNLIYAGIFEMKNKFTEKIKMILPDPEGALLRGLLLGERSGLGEKIKQDFAITGTSHIVAVSGFNVTIVAAIILEIVLLLGFSRNQSFWISLLAIVLFIIMVGSPASAIRAGIMGGLVMAAMRAGRLSAVSTAIVFAATLMMAANPKILRFDAGFQLSFLAVMGLVWVYPMLDYHFRKLPDILKIKSMLLVTVSAQIAALPVLIYNFDRLSIIAPVANVLILPFVPLAMASGFLAGIFAFVWILPAKTIGYFAWFILTYQIRVIGFLASLPWTAVTIWNFGAGAVILYYSIATFLIIKANKKRPAEN